MVWNRKKRLELVHENAAAGEIAEIFAQVRDELGMPFVSAYYQSLAFCPPFLRLHWDAMRPLVHSSDFQKRSDRLRAEAYTAIHNYFSVSNLSSAAEGTEQQLTQAVEYFYERDAMLLLITALQSTAFEGTPSSEPRPNPLQPHRAQPEVASLLVPNDGLAHGIRNVFDDMRRHLDVAVATPDYAALGRWPKFVFDWWRNLKPNVASPLYPEQRRRIGDSAMQHAAELPSLSSLSVQALEDQGLSKEQIGSIVHINEAFYDAFSNTVLNFAFAHISLEGGNGRGAERAA
jgi:Halocarboxylic acid dehydrogenase DehI